jgi:hypothetical protein
MLVDLGRNDVGKVRGRTCATACLQGVGAAALRGLLSHLPAASKHLTHARSCSARFS